MAKPEKKGGEHWTDNTKRKLGFSTFSERFRLCFRFSWCAVVKEREHGARKSKRMFNENPSSSEEDGKVKNEMRQKLRSSPTKKRKFWWVMGRLLSYHEVLCPIFILIHWFAMNWQRNIIKIKTTRYMIMINTIDKKINLTEKRVFTAEKRLSEDSLSAFTLKPQSVSSSHNLGFEFVQFATFFGNVGLV